MSEHNITFNKIDSAVYDDYKYVNKIKLLHVVKLLVDFKMRTDQSYDLPNYIDLQRNLFDNYYNYIFDRIEDGSLESVTNDELHPDHPIDNSIISVSFINKTKLIDFLRNNHELGIDVDELVKLICFTPKSNIADSANKYSDSKTSINIALWKQAVNLVVGNRIERYNNEDNHKSKNAMRNGTKTWPYEIKSVYKTLKYINDDCKCISLALEKIILEEMDNESADFSNEELIACEDSELASTDFLAESHIIPSEHTKSVKESVNLAMSSDPVAITRIYKKWITENGNPKKLWAPSWHQVKCELHPTSSNAAPPKKKK